MKSKELYELVRQGKKPVIKFNKGVYDYCDDSFDPLMIGRITGVSIEFEDSYRFLVDLNDYEAHNRSVALYDWKDKNGNPTLTWFDTVYYPKDGIEVMYLPGDYSFNIEDVFDFVEENSLFQEFLNSKTNLTYVEWLEIELIKSKSS